MERVEERLNAIEQSLTDGRGQTVVHQISKPDA